MRAWLLAAMVGVLAGCNTTPTPRSNAPTYPVKRVPPPGTTAGTSAAPAMQLSTGAAALQPAPASPYSAPSLDQERQAQAQREARALASSAVVKVERVEGAGPAWWPASWAGGDGYGRGQGAALDGAYQLAARQAAGADRGASVSRVAYTRLGTGEYVVWVGLKSVDTAVSAPTGAPGQTADVPSWFTNRAREENGRVTVGAMADAPSVREAPRLASDAGRAELAVVLGVEPAEVRLESTYVRKQGDGYRAYVLVSCAGTMKK